MECILCKNESEIYNANGKPINYVVNGKDVVCMCPSCIRKVLQNYYMLLRTNNLPDDAKKQIIENINVILNTEVD